METTNEENSQQTGPRTWLVDALVALVMMLIGAIVMYNSARIGSGWGDDGPRSGYFPFYIGLLIVVSSTMNLVRALRNKRDATVFVRRPQLKLVLAILVPSIAYVVAIRFLGIYVASALFIGAFVRWQGKFGAVKILLVSLGVSIALFFMFEVWFKVALPKGPLEALLGY